MDKLQFSQFHSGHLVAASLFCCGIFVFYLLTQWFYTIHLYCVFGGAINILVNLQTLTTECYKEHGQCNRSDLIVQFHGLCLACKYGLTGYFLSFGVAPYLIYRLLNPNQNLKEISKDLHQTYEEMSSSHEIFNKKD